MSEPTPETPAPEAPAGTDTPPWGSDEDFKPDKAWSLIQNLRGDVEKLKARPVLDEATKAKVAEFDRITEAAKTDLDKAKDEAQRWQTDAQTWRTAAVGSKIQALAATDFADPSDAVTALADKNYLDAGGQINETAIRKDLADLLAAKPHYKRPDDGPRPPAPNPAQGTSANGAAPSGPAQDFAASLQSALAG